MVKGHLPTDIPLYSIIGDDVYGTYGDTFPSNLDLLYRLVKVADMTIDGVFNRDKLISQLYSTTKRASHD